MSDRLHVIISHAETASHSFVDIMSKATIQPDIDLALKLIFRKQAFRSVQREVIEVDL